MSNMKKSLPMSKEMVKFFQNNNTAFQMQYMQTPVDQFPDIICGVDCAVSGSDQSSTTIWKRDEHGQLRLIKD